jgi:hypothetical protein
MSKGEAGAGAQSVPATPAEDRTLLSFLPKPVRVPVRWLVEVVGVLGALAALASWFGSFFSFVGRLVIWQDAWALVVNWAGGFPELLRIVIQPLGLGAHYVVERYQEIVHPMLEWVFGLLNLSVQAWVLDAIFLGSFAIFSFVRYARNVVAPEVSNEMEMIFGDILDYIWESKIFAPIALINAIGLAIVSPIWLIGAKLYMRYNNIGERVGLGILYTSVALGLTLPLLLLYFADWLYRTTH